MTASVPPPTTRAEALDRAAAIVARVLARLDAEAREKSAADDAKRRRRRTA